ncbi:MAG: AI-2E family transporter [Bacteroidetes bacterium]|nr:AI-2E family transporter [Bacteroidota bacterium]
MPITENTAKRIWKILGVLATLGIIIYFGIIFSHIIILLVISMLLALIFNPMVTVLEKNGLSRLISILIVFLISGGVMVFGFSVLIPKVIYQMNMISQNVNQKNVTFLLNQVQELISKYLPFVDSGEFIIKLQGAISSQFFNSIDNISNILSSLVSILAISLIVPFMTFFLLKDRNEITKGIINIMPNKYFEVSYWVIKKISDKLGKFVRGWIFDAFCVGVLSAIGLSVLGIKNSVTIGMIAGLGHLIPYFGPIIGGLPAIVISMIQFGDFSRLPSILIMFVIVYTIDNGYIQPNVFSKSTDIHPLMIILLILVGSQLMGVLGMLLAVPIATVVKTASKEIYFGYKNYKILRA